MTRIGRMAHHSAKRVHMLAGKLVDERIRNAEWRELQALLKGSAEARQAYVKTIMIQANLHYMVSETRQER